jgi:hypothetical protein
VRLGFVCCVGRECSRLRECVRASLSCEGVWCVCVSFCANGHKDAAVWWMVSPLRLESCALGAFHYCNRSGARVLLCAPPLRSLVGGLVHTQEWVVTVMIASLQVEPFIGRERPFVCRSEGRQLLLAWVVPAVFDVTVTALPREHNHHTKDSRAPCCCACSRASRPVGLTRWRRLHGEGPRQCARRR